MRKSHTGANIANFLLDILNEWGIKDEIVTIVSDNGLGYYINVHLGKHHHLCVAHTLNLSINEASMLNDNFLNALRKCHTLVGHFKQFFFRLKK